MNNGEKNLQKMIFVVVVLCSTIFGISFSLINNDSVAINEEHETYDKNLEELATTKKDPTKIYVRRIEKPNTKKITPLKPQSVKGLFKLGEFDAVDKKKKNKETYNENENKKQ